VIATCPYCGFTFTVGGSEIKHLVIPNRLDSKSVKKVVNTWLKKAAAKTVGTSVLKELELEEPILQWIPLFRVKGDYESYHFGYKKKGTGGDTRHIRIEDSDVGVTTEWVVARRHAATFGINEFIHSIDDNGIKKFDIELAGGAPVLNSEIDESDASRRAEQSRKARERAELLESVDKLLDHRLSITPKDSTYTHAAYWLVRYSYQKGTFRIAVSGATGEVLLGELPVTKRYRAKKWISSIILLVSSALLFQALPYILYVLFQGSSNNDDIWMVPVVIALVAGVLWFGSITVLGGALRYEVEVDTEGKERGDHFSLTGAIKKLGGK